jgi:hypothetical protein
VSFPQIGRKAQPGRRNGIDAGYVRLSGVGHCEAIPGRIKAGWSLKMAYLG